MRLNNNNIVCFNRVLSGDDGEKAWVKRLYTHTRDNIFFFSKEEHLKNIMHLFRYLQSENRSRMSSNDEAKVVSVKINYQKFEDSTLYRLKKKTVVRIVPSESLLGKHITIQTNYPLNEKDDFVRNKFASLEWFSRFGEKISARDQYAEIHDLEMYCQVTLLRSGTFRFYILEEERLVLNLHNF